MIMRKSVLCSIVLMGVFLQTMVFAAKKPDNARDGISHDDPASTFRARMNEDSMGEEIRCYVEDLGLSREGALSMLFRMHCGIGSEFKLTPKRFYKFVRINEVTYELTPKLNKGFLVGLSAKKVDDPSIPEELVTVIKIDDEGNESVEGYYCSQGISLIKTRYTTSTDGVTLCDMLEDYDPKHKNWTTSECWWIPSKFGYISREKSLKDEFVQKVFSKVSFDKANESSARSIEQRLNDVKTLMDKGLISEDEYTKQRSRILENL